MVLINKEWFGLCKEINFGELAHWVKNNFQMQNFCDPYLPWMILWYEINQLQNQSRFLRTLGVNGNKGHIHQRLVLRVKESIWLQTGGRGGRGQGRGKRGKFQWGQKPQELLHIQMRALLQEAWMLFPEISPTDIEFFKHSEGREEDSNTSGTAFTMLTRVAGEVKWECELNYKDILKNSLCICFMLLFFMSS